MQTHKPWFTTRTDVDMEQIHFSNSDETIRLATANTENVANVMQYILVNLKY